jgi:hypothetical protein
MGAFVSPTRGDRERARGLLLHGDFLEVYCRCAIEVCERRDPKGHYRRARHGEIKEFTGVSAPYEEPFDPELVLDTDTLTLEESVERALALLVLRGVLPRQPDAKKRKQAVNEHVPAGQARTARGRLLPLRAPRSCCAPCYMRSSAIPVASTDSGNDADHGAQSVKRHG